MGRPKLLETEMREEENEELEKQPKAIRFFSQFNDANFDYVVTLYRKDAKGKRVAVKEYHNDVPSLNSIQEMFGGGEYTMYANRYENGKSVEQLDTVTINIADHIRPESNVSGNNSNDIFSFDSLQKLGMIKTIFSNDNNSGGDISNVLMKMSEMQTQSLMKVMEMQQQSEKRTAELINNFNDKFTNLIVEMKTNKPAISELTDMFTLFSEMSGGKSESSPLDKLLEYAPVLLQAQSNTGNVPAQQQTVSYVPKKSRAEEINEVISRIPKDVIGKLTEENKEGIINIFYEKNKHICGRNDIEDIVNEILSRKQRGII